MDAEIVLNLRRSGKGYNEICRLTGMTKNQVGYICRRHGEGGFVGGAFPLTDQQVKDIVSMSGFDYVGGYETTKKPITVRCRKCGRTFERQFHIFRDLVNGTWQNKNECPLCRSDKQRAERERKAKEAKAEREREARIKAEQRAMREADLISRQAEERLANHVCKNCGKEYCIGTTGYNSKQYCSKKCMKRWVMRVKNDRRLRRMMAREHDTDITLEKLFKRDGGVCYICGNLCSWDDVVDGNAGEQYPSIDHVKPLAKGGTHTWNNIKLACRKCNWEKNDTEKAPVG